jgi:iron-sulfur cluster repair protein YtfE (RIC family)
MSTITTPGAKPGLKRYNIRICTGGTTAMQTAIARNSQQAWNMAFDLCERLLGDKPPRSVSVKPVTPAYGLQEVAA